ncbi:RagB/SusD family nutrient uptake outer membrane protein [Chitinophaga oryzae]|uniref:RagB/SusD family nutrient uptake outer membrane protein n=1 Tax=Chitinophaga oryzae TaxID=2725414 RepID=A0AAE7DBQ2_9BACT|nr:RagB/SusD family nutrient uptake outer membrane protein [Chitinophaga oryzae]QJB35794.1 RagB/SusD family nutrient uptake outer membrane protein [Chitinophaga oryzae]QJB42319.1 RagB/SusD family nutrient uptake outer membrane protein [Chitinophaga oryzae]
MKKLIICLSGALLALSACQKGEINSLNTPVVGGIVVNPSRSDLFNLVTGAESGLRNNAGTYLDGVGVMGREEYRFSGSEPRWTTDMLGGGSKQLDNNTFYITNPFAARYQVARQCFILMQALKTTRAEVASDAQKKAFQGFAETLIGYQLLMNINMTDSNGARIPVADNANLGPIITNPGTVLDSVIKFLDAGKTSLTGSDVLFPLSDGFKDFKTAAGLLKFNRAIAARVHIYRKNWAAALTALNESFFDLNGSFTMGVYSTYSTNGGDQINPMYLQPNATGEVRVAHPSFATDIVPGDNRLSTKTALRNAPVSSVGLTGNRDLTLWPTLSSPISIIRNEELILIYAEAKIQLNQLPDAIVALNRIRTGHNLPPYAGAATQDALINELLYNRRYSLFMEGHRWIDMRRYKRLNQLPIDRTGDDVWSRYPLPMSETNQ